MRPAFKSMRLIVLGCALVMTTAMAASPIRTVMWPLASRQLARWSPELPGRVPLADDSPLARNAGVTSPDAQAGTTDLAYAGRPVGMNATSPTVPSPGNRDVSALLDSRPLSYVPFQGTGEGRDRDDASRASAGGGRSAGRSVGAGFGPMSQGSGRAPMFGASRAEGRAPVERGATSSNGRGPASPGGPPRTSPAAPAAPAASGAPPASGIFTTHLTQPPILVATGGGTSGGVGSFVPTSVSSTPEPSTLLLLGTGIALAARGLRRTRTSSSR